MKDSACEVSGTKQMLMNKDALEAGGSVDEKGKVVETWMPEIQTFSVSSAGQ